MYTATEVRGQQETPQEQSQEQETVAGMNWGGQRSPAVARNPSLLLNGFWGTGGKLHAEGQQRGYKEEMTCRSPSTCPPISSPLVGYLK